MSNIVHSSVGGFVVQQRPNVNAAYGPWDSLDEAKTFLQQHFLEVDENMHIAPNIPVGTTVAIYTDSSKQVISEYWWSKNDLIQKTFGGSQYTLKLEDKKQKSVRAITIKDGYENEPNTVKPITFKNDQVVNFGTVSYSIDGGSYVTYDPNTRVHADGIPTSSIAQSLIIEWRDSDNQLLTYCDVPVHQLQNIVQEYYAYNNSENKEDAPEIAIYDESSPSYQGIDWTPNVYGRSDWSLVPFGVEADNHVEWAVRRTRTNGLWGKLEGPYINRRWGVDGIVAVDKQILYYYSPELIEGKLDDEFSYDLEYLETYVPDDIVVTEDYTVVNTQTNTTRVWTPTYKSVDPYDNRYCYVTQRYKGIREGSYQFGNWTTVALYTNFAVDGKDGDNIEYIYCLSKTDSLDTEAINQLNAINAQHSTSGTNPGSEIIFGDKWMWTDDPSGISLEVPYEFCAKRDISKDYSGKFYGEFGKPFLWASLGKEGPDGPGLEYVYIATSSKSEVPTIDCSSQDSRGHNKQDEDYLPKYIKGEVVREWSDDPIAVTPSLPILWMSKRKSKRGVWLNFSDPIVWNEFKYSYEIHLSNDNCAIPATVDGTYSIAAAQSATATKVEVRLGLETVDIEAEGITIECDKYIKKEGTDSYCLNDNTIVFDNDNPVYLAQFVAKKEGNVVAKKTQTVSLNKGTSSYHLRCFPNSRMWYGGNQYSVNSFNVQVYVSDSDGAYYEIDDISDYVIKYQLARSTTIYEIKNITDHTIAFQNETQDQDIYLQLYSKDDKLLDDEVIDGIDYSKIKGKDHDGITIELNDQVNIPRSKMNNLEYIKNKTATRVTAYKSLKEYPIEDVTVTAVSCDAFETKLSVGYNEDTKQYYLSSVMTGDVQMLYTVKILVGGEEVTYEKVQNINVSNTLIDYELIPSIRHVCYNKNVGCNVQHIFFTIRSGETDEKNQPIIPAYKIRWSIENSNEPAKDLTADVFDTELINDYLIGCGGTLQTLSFELLVEDQRADSENIEFWCEPTLDGYNYTIDLSNPHLEIPKAINNSSFGDKLKNWTTTDIVVCQSGQKLTTKTNTYPHFKVSVINGGSFVAHEEQTSDTIHRVYFKPGIPLTIEQVNYAIYVCERYGDDYIEFNRSQSVVFTDKEAYQLISNPTTINLNYAEERTFKYTPTIQKMSYSGELTELTTSTELLSENLKLYLDGSEYELGNDFTIGQYRTNAIPVLLKDNNGYLYDYDDITLSRNGERGSDGISVEYIYGRAFTSTNNGIITNYESNDITKCNKETYTVDQWKAGVTVDNIIWYDDPQGIDENHQQEFISVSKYENKEWSPFSTPKIHAQFGKKGEDGNGVEYIYTACQRLYTKTLYEDDTQTKAIGFIIDNEVYSNDSYIDGKKNLIRGTHYEENGTLTLSTNNQDEDDCILPGWFDNIPDLSEEYPNLYVSSRKRIKGEWGPFKEPALWNKYSANLELILDNDLVIIDDNSTADTIKELSYTNVQAFYKGKLITGKVTVSTSGELEGSFLKATQDGTKDAFYLKLEGGELSDKTSGQVTYTFSHEGETISRKQTIYVKDFSVGEGYKLMLMPSVVNTENKDGKYSWTDTTIQCSVVKIHGAESTNVNLAESTDLTVDVYYNNVLEESNVKNSYTIFGESDATERPDISFVLRKSNVDVDIQSVIFSSKGADGAAGVSPFVLNLTDDTDSVFVNNDTKAVQEGDTTVEIYYKNVDLLTLTQNKLSWGANTTYDNTYRLEYNKKPFDGVEFQYNSNTHKMEYKIKKSFYNNIKSTQSIKLPIELSINYDGHKTTLNTTYHVNIFKDIVRREIYCDYSTIKVTQQDDGSTKITPASLPIIIREYNGNSYSNKTLADLKGICKLEYSIDDESFESIDSQNTDLTIPSRIKNRLTLKLTDLRGTSSTDDDLEIDKEILPVITDGKIGSNGKSTAIRMRDKWVENAKYYGGDELDPDVGDNIYYTDVVAYGDESKFAFYQAKKYHISDSKNCPPSGDVEENEHWRKVAYSALTLTQQLLITNEDAKITGGFVDVEKAQIQKDPTNPDNQLTNDGIILWAGSDPEEDSVKSANNATFSVTRSGVIKASKGLFEGSYMPGTRTLTSPKIKNTLNILACENPDSTLQTSIDLDIDYSEISESMNFDFQWVEMSSEKLTKDPIPVVTKLTKTNSTWAYTVEDVNIYNTIGAVNLRLPVGLYVVYNNGSYDPSNYFVQFIRGMHKYRFSSIDEDQYIKRLKFDENDNVKVSSGYTPLDEYLRELTKIPDSNSIDLCTDKFGSYFNLPFITYINDIKNNNKYTPGQSENYLQFFEPASYQSVATNTYIDGFLERQLQEVLPFLGKTVTLTNVPGIVNIVGVLPPELTNLQNLGDCVKHSVKLCRYLTQDNTYLDTVISGKKFVQLRCKSYPLVPIGEWINQNGDKVTQNTRETYGFFIGWELVSCSVESTDSKQYQYRNTINQSNPSITYSKS